MRTSISIVAILALGCTASTVGEPVGVLDAGVWGGDRANLIVTRDSARTEFDCASGRLDVPISLDAAGRFEVGGSYRPEVGPVFAPVPARWTGEVVTAPGGSRITLTGVVSPPNAAAYTVGPFHLVHGQRLTLYVCA
jgi:hypothetical protein